MSRTIPSPSLAAKALLVSAVLLVFAPIGVLAHEASEHGAEDVSHCACLVCHSTVNTPMNVQRPLLNVLLSDGAPSPCIQETYVVRTAEAWPAVSERAPPLD